MIVWVRGVVLTSPDSCGVLLTLLNYPVKEDSELEGLMALAKVVEQEVGSGPAGRGRRAPSRR